MANAEERLNLIHNLGPSPDAFIFESSSIRWAGQWCVAPAWIESAGCEPPVTALDRPGH